MPLPRTKIEPPTIEALNNFFIVCDDFFTELKSEFKTDKAIDFQNHLNLIGETLNKKSIGPDKRQDCCKLLCSFSEITVVWALSALKDAENRRTRHVSSNEYHDDNPELFSRHKKTRKELEAIRAKLKNHDPAYVHWEEIFKLFEQAVSKILKAFEYSRELDDNKLNVEKKSDWQFLFRFITLASLVLSVYAIVVSLSRSPS